MDTENPKNSISSMTDAELLQQYRQGHEWAFRELVDRYKDPLYAFLRRFVSQQDMVEDIFQETFLQLFTSQSSFDINRPLRPWLFTIAANKARDLHRSRSRRPEVELDAQVTAGQEGGQRFLDFLAGTADSPLAVLTATEQEEVVRRVLDDMPEHLREVLVLSYYHRFPYKEIALILNVPLGTVKSRLHAAVGFFGKRYMEATKSEP